MLMPGDAICSTRYGEATNLFIGGKYKHVGIYVGEMDGVPMVVEAIGKGVAYTDLIQFMLSKDVIGAFRPKFAGKEEMSAAAKKAIETVGSPYDYGFDSGNEAYYCSELYYYAYAETLRSCPLELRPRMGRLTITPSDIWLAINKFKTVWESK
jgi:uncharacterized protein YycO